MGQTYERKFPLTEMRMKASLRQCSLKLRSQGLAPGTGKTALLRSLVYDLASAFAVPVFIHISKGH